MNLSIQVRLIHSYFFFFLAIHNKKNVCISLFAKLNKASKKKINDSEIPHVTELNRVCIT